VLKIGKQFHHSRAESWERRDDATAQESQDGSIDGNLRNIDGHIHLGDWSLESTLSHASTDIVRPMPFSKAVS
jgi:hypothetical protein